MNHNNKPNNNNINNRRFNTIYTKKINARTKRILDGKGKNKIFTFFLYGIGSFFVLILIVCVYLYSKYIIGLPSISELENLEIAESSIIYDRDGNELYKLFKEKRTYVSYENINKNMINALVSIEDKRYWTNPGVDIMGLFRAGANFVFGKSSEVKGTSTLTQQLIRNTIITNEKSVERKVKEIYLAYKLTSTVSKEKILELYLNKIEYGHNAFGIEEAAKTFFGKSAKDLNVLEASILASLPKGPTYYSPYNHPDRLIGYPYIYTKGDEDNKIKVITQKDKDDNKEMLSHLTNFIGSLKANKLEGTEKILICNLDEKNFKTKISIDGDGCSVVEYAGLIDLLNNIRIKVDDNYIEYETGRKDRVLGRMLEDGYIDFSEYKKDVVDAIGYTFNRKNENIKSPHFVFYIKEYLEEKYGKEIVSVGGLKIYTTLDSKLQEKAEDLVKKQAEKNTKNFDASNAALISIDNKTGDILAMVGGKDYFDTDNKGNVNIITSKLQPGSTFKPFVYSMAMFKNEIGTKTPIYDVETKFPSGYTPSNFDLKFMGKINISTALNYSRNIPAIKMFFMAGGEKEIVNFMNKLGVESLKENMSYGAPMGLGTGEMTPLELASAYTVFANLGIKKEISPILKIVDSKGNIIEEKKQKTKEDVVMDPGQAYLINNVLSDTTSRPAGWNKYISLKNRVVAAKTGTSTKQYIKNGKKEVYPSNIWTAGYTPQITTIVWAGNTDGSKLNHKGNGLEGAGPIWRDFMEFALKDKKVETWKRPSNVKEIYISEISGLLPNPEAGDKGPVISSLFINTPKSYDNSFKQEEVDSLCNGKVTENTPQAAIKTVTIVKLRDVDPTNPTWQAGVQEWAKSDDFNKKYGGNYPDLVTYISDQECSRSGNSGDITINSNINDNDTLYAGENYIKIGYKSVTPIVRIDVMIDDMVIQELKIDNKTEGIYEGNIFIPVSKAGNQTNLKFRAVNEELISNEVLKVVNILKEDNNPPEIKLINPIDGSIKLYNDDYFNLKAEINDGSSLKNISILLDGQVLKSNLTDRILVFPINSDKDISIGNHTITIEVTDTKLNISSKTIQIEIIQR